MGFTQYLFKLINKLIRQPSSKSWGQWWRFFAVVLVEFVIIILKKKQWRIWALKASVFKLFFFFCFIVKACLILQLHVIRWYLIQLLSLHDHVLFQTWPNPKWELWTSVYDDSFLIYMGESDLDSRLIKLVIWGFGSIRSCKHNYTRWNSPIPVTWKIR